MSGDDWQHESLTDGLACTVWPVLPARAPQDPEVVRIQRNMDLLCGLPDDPFAEEDR